MENRARLLLEIIQAIRALVGKDYPLWCRLDGSQYGVAEGLTLEESREVARMIQAAGVNAIHVSAYGEGIHCLSTTPDSPGYLVPLAEGIKRAVSVPVIAVGRLDPQLGETILKNGQADLITMGRRLIADPDLPRKAASGKFEEIVPCTACLHCVDAIMIQGDEVHCRINALARKTGEYKIKPAEKAKRVMVVGGGPAGMEAARVASQRGHEVTLYEKARRLGGKLILASVLDEEKDSIIRYLSGQMKNLGVKVETGREVTPSLISESRPDVLILATGAAPLLPEIKGIEGKKVVSPAAIQGMASGHLKGGISINRPWIERVLWHLGSLVFRFMSPFRIASLTKLWLPFGKKVVVMGGNMAGCQLADFLTERGRRVTLLELTARFASDMLVLPRYVLLDRLTRKEVVMWKGLKEYKEITERGLVVITKDLKEQVIDADTIIPNLASLPHTELFKAMEGKVPEIYSAGDCQGSSLILEAVRDGFRIGRSI